MQESLEKWHDIQHEEQLISLPIDLTVHDFGRCSCWTALVGLDVVCSPPA